MANRAVNRSVIGKDYGPTSPGSQGSTAGFTSAGGAGGHLGTGAGFNPKVVSGITGSTAQAVPPAMPSRTVTRTSPKNNRAR